MTCMKFSEPQMDILGLFMNINPSIMFKPGQKVSTISNNRNILGSCVFKDIEFERKAPIYDLGNMMKTIKVLSRNTSSTPDVNFDEKFVDISLARSRMKYYYAEERMITVPPEKINSLGEPAITTEIFNEQLFQIFSAAASYQLPDLCFQGKNGILYAIVTDKRNSTANTLEIELGETDREFCFCMKIENMAVVMSGGTPCRAVKGFKVDLYEQKVAKLYGIVSENSSVQNLELMIALEPDSEY